MEVSPVPPRRKVISECLLAFHLPGSNVFYNSGALRRESEGRRLHEHKFVLKTSQDVLHKGHLRAIPSTTAITTNP